MQKKIKTQVANAIKWIDSLKSGEYKQAPKGERGRLGNHEQGYCCIGVGCAVLKVPHLDNDTYSVLLKDKVGLMTTNGQLSKTIYYKRYSLVTINDETVAGFKRIGTLLITRADQLFSPEVAEGIEQYYSSAGKS